MIVIYTRNSCAWCNTVKRYLAAKGKQFTVKNIDEDPQAAAEYRAFGVSTVPVITGGDFPIFGWKPAELAKL